ncbi:Protein of unknown function [Gryllus bimaculatus]|nr:Protein of unknown function [Gryllus bimaculatus]
MLGRLSTSCIEHRKDPVLDDRLNIGSTLGLLMGASLLSLVEVIHFFVLPLGRELVHYLFGDGATTNVQHQLQHLVKLPRAKMNAVPAVVRRSRRFLWHHSSFPNYSCNTILDEEEKSNTADVIAPEAAEHDLLYFHHHGFGIYDENPLTPTEPVTHYTALCLVGVPQCGAHLRSANCTLPLMPRVRELRRYPVTVDGRQPADYSGGQPLHPPLFQFLSQFGQLLGANLSLVKVNSLRFAVFINSILRLLINIMFNGNTLGLLMVASLIYVEGYFLLLAVNIGGTLGLLMGASLLSLVEVIHFFVLPMGSEILRRF